MIEIFIPTHKRPEWCLNLIKEIEFESKNLKYNIRVFHDVCDEDYSQVESYCKSKENLFYYKSLKPFGKNGFWELNNIMYSFLNTLECDYYIQLVDDLTLVKDFTQRAVNCVSGAIDCVNLGTSNVHLKTFMTQPIEIINGIEMWNNNWNDCGFVAKTKVIKNIRIEQPPIKRNNNPLLGSGVAQEFIKAYNRITGKRIYQVVYALYEHLGAVSTVMHRSDRKFLQYGDSYVIDPLRMNLHKSDFEYCDKKFRILTKKYQNEKK